MITMLLYLPLILTEGLTQYYYSGSVGSGNTSSALSLFLKEPFQIIKYGFERITNNEWTSSSGVNSISSYQQIIQRFVDVYSSFYSGGKSFYFGGKIISLIVVSIAMMGSLISVFHPNKKNCFFGVFNSSAFITIVLAIIIQDVLPFERVLAYLAIPVSIGFSISIMLAFKCLKGFYMSKLCLYICILLFSIYSFCIIDYNGAYYLDYETDKQIREMISVVDMKQVKSVLFGSEYQQLHMNYYADIYDWNYTEQDLTAPDLVMLNRYQMEPEFEALSWPDYLGYTNFPWDYINSEMELIYLNKHTVVYKKTVFN